MRTTRSAAAGLSARYAGVGDSVPTWTVMMPCEGYRSYSPRGSTRLPTVRETVAQRSITPGPRENGELSPAVGDVSGARLKPADYRGLASRPSFSRIASITNCWIVVSASMQ